MNMMYGSSLNPKWMVDALWRKRKLIFFAISAASLAGNVVVLAESLGIYKPVVSLISWMLLQLHDTGKVIAQSPVLCLLLNLIMLGMVVKLGVLGVRAANPVAYVISEAEIDTQAEATEPICEISDDHLEAHAHQQTFMTSVCMKRSRRASAVKLTYTEPPALDSNACVEQGLAGIKPTRRAAGQTKQASLFTIEPLDSSIEPPSNSSLSASQILSAAQLDTTGPMSIHTTPPNMFTGGHLAKECQIEYPSISRGASRNGVNRAPHKNSTPNHFNHREDLDDNDLNRQEFNERVETFITKFKRNITMQRQDSFNRLLGLVGVGVKKP